ncbi:Sau3AI family type II restriction endonuclease [Arcobacter sp.]|uniref:Sau3AI family type II restriction endonuclease n=1 Tax=unclassified Arcobacter TaxID=2593671 RepID=UPI003B007647
MKFNYDKNSKESILEYSKQFIDKSLYKILDDGAISILEEKINEYKGKRKGLLGDIVEEYLFGIKNNNDKSPDFKEVGMELKTTPLKFHKKNKYSAKERLVFSMIDYMTVVNENWETSSFLEKNKLLLLMFYLFEGNKSLLEYEFKFVKMLNLLSEISDADIAQIQKDWETIVNKIRRGEAHLLSEGDTLYLGAATKASKSTNRRPQPYNDEGAKPRAFSFKNTYINYLIKKFLGNEDKGYVSLIQDNLPLTIEENIFSRLKPYIGKSNLELEKQFHIVYENKRPKHHRRILVNRLLGYSTNKIEEFEKANITLKAIAIESSGVLKESISFEIFRYKDIINEVWEESAFYNQLSSKKFLFLIFKKTKEGDIFKEIRFWNFPVKDLDKAQWVWDETVRRIRDNKTDKLPSIKEGVVAHVRPHGLKGNDTIETAHGTKEVKKCFWLNAKYIQEQLKTKDII